MLADNERLCIRQLTAKSIKEMDTYNYRGFVGQVVVKHGYYVISNITENPVLIGAGRNIETAMAAFQKTVDAHLRALSRNSQEKMLVRRFRKRELISKRFNDYAQSKYSGKWVRM